MKIWKVHILSTHALPIIALHNPSHEKVGTENSVCRHPLKLNLVAINIHWVGNLVTIDTGCSWFCLISLIFNEQFSKKCFIFHQWKSVENKLVLLFGTNFTEKCGGSSCSNCILAWWQAGRLTKKLVFTIISSICILLKTWNPQPKTSEQQKLKTF